MYLQQSDLLWGMDKEFVQKFIGSGMKETHPKGFKLFQEGEPAEFFFIMVKGSIRISLGEHGRTTYLVNHAGEAFGWSSLVGMKSYTASAQCLKETTFIRFTKEFVDEIVEEDPVNGMKFYKRLAGMLGNRLIHSYHLEPADLSDGLEYSFGSGKDIESYTTG
ncbi:Crp/Fnr family transcriptional regulator [Desulforhopalus singaporensis]|uniref:Cyclic nucleotide-binding domain-containing protein n=1 Tax=Desulforhopalus singaporensis TaxID=91360 RepID=A0A1H0TLS6_9BACT|nr:Crp/Fnr family transcriptional regulator [Desulforhopalus singaporensis]SDP54791.1 Cyclic nucleotide-binding domain-containing protein [Desulforhopalus singaporensis]